MKTKFTLITLFTLLLMCIGTMDTKAQKKDQFINKVPIPYTIEGPDWRLHIIDTIHNFDPNGAINSIIDQRTGDTLVFDLKTDVQAFGYNFPDSLNQPGAMTYLGPTFVVPRTNDWIDFPITNKIDTLTTVHWHGLNLPAEADGGPHQRIQKNTTWHSVFPIIDEVQTAWYHSHLMDFTTDQVTRGMAGMMYIQDPNNDPLYSQLPHDYGVNDLALALQAKNFEYDTLSTNNYKSTAIKAGIKPGPGRWGMVNGVVAGALHVPQSMVRLRLLNGATNKIMNIGLTKEPIYEKTDGDVDFRTMYMVATGGGYLDYPRPTQNNLLSLGDRREFVVDFGAYNNGDTLFLVHYQNRLPADATYGKNWYSSALMAFVVDNTIQPANPVTSLPATLKPLDPVPGPLDTTRTKVLTGFAPGGGGGGPWLIDGAPMILNVINDTVLVNTKERWNIDNQTMHAHPWHIHKVQFQVVEYIGKLGLPDGNGGYVDSVGHWTWPDLPDELVGYKDVQLVRENAIMSYEARFDSFPSPMSLGDSLFTHGFMYHCHILSHEDTSMMHQFVVVDQLTPPIPPGDECADALDINDLFGGPLNEPQVSALQDNTQFTSVNDPSDANDCHFDTDPLAHTIWYSFTSPDGATYGIKTIECDATNYIDFGDTQMTIYEGDECGNLTQVDCNDDEDGGNNLFNANIELPTNAGSTYYIIIDGYEDLVGEFCIEVTNLAPNRIEEIEHGTLQLYPNPATNTINFASTFTSFGELRFYDISGKLLRQQKVASLPGTTLSVADLPRGMVLVEFISGDNSFQEKLVLK